MLPALVVTTQVAAVRQAFAVVEAVEYVSYEAEREPGLLWLSRANAAQAPPQFPQMVIHVLALAAYCGARASWVGARYT